MAPLMSPAADRVLLASACALILGVATAGAEGHAGSAAQDSAAAATPARPDSSRPGLPPSLLSGGASEPVAATGQAVDPVRWVAGRRRFSLPGTNYGVTGLPIAYYSPGTGWNYGARVQLSDYSRRPYRYKLTLHWVRSTEGKRNTSLQVKVPHISGTGFGLNVLASDRRDIRARYFGLSNDSDFDKDLIDRHSQDYVDEDYYFYVLEEPRVIVSLLRDIYGPVFASVGLGLEHTDVDPLGLVSYYKDAGTPDGVTGGVTAFVSFTLSWDTRDDPTIPRRGAFHEWSYETSRNSLLSLFFEEIDFQRYTFTDARYNPLTPRLWLAHRTIFEALKGAVPLYAYGELGGSRRIKGLGGSDTLRGFDRQRFTDNIRLLTNTEARYRLGSASAFRQYFDFDGVLFVDSGQVAPGMADLRPLEMHLTAGWGLRAVWNEDFVVGADVGLSPEQVYTSFKYHNVF